MIPKNLQSAVWNINTDKLDLQNDKQYIIHQILAFGTWEQLQWLLKNYPKNIINDIFIQSPEKNYTPSAYNFIKNVFLNINMVSLNKENYVRTYPRRLG